MSNNNFIQSVDERTSLAGANRLEILLFSLGKEVGKDHTEVFGINVFKIREVMHLPEVTRAPDMPPGVKGMVSLRGAMIPIIDLAHFCSMEVETPPKVLIITEFNNHTQGFLVNSVEQIMRMEWNEIKVPPPMMAHKHGGLITAVTELKDKRIVMVIDVEKVLAETLNADDEMLLFEGIDKIKHSATVLYADDSAVARKQIEKTLDLLGVKHMGAKNGEEAWQKLQDLAQRAKETGREIKELVNIILTDIEMPGMDGYVLTRKIKQDPRFKDIPVIMHSSLSADANVALGKSVGVNAYVPKFDPRILARTILPYLDGDTSAIQSFIDKV